MYCYILHFMRILLTVDSLPLTSLTNCRIRWAFAAATSAVAAAKAAAKANEETEPVAPLKDAPRALQLRFFASCAVHCTLPFSRPRYYFECAPWWALRQPMQAKAFLGSLAPQGS